jgi:hypothetical protein
LKGLIGIERRSNWAIGADVGAKRRDGLVLEEALRRFERLLRTERRSHDWWSLYRSLVCRLLGLGIVVVCVTCEVG